MDSPGQRLKEWRKINKFTMKEVAEKSGISQGGLSDCENDKVMIGSKVLLSLYRYYGIDIQWILTGERKENINLSENEEELLKQFRYLPEREQLKCIGRMEQQAEEYKSSRKEESFSSKIG